MSQNEQQQYGSIVKSVESINETIKGLYVKMDNLFTLVMELNNTTARQEERLANQIRQQEKHAKEVESLKQKVYLLESEKAGGRKISDFLVKLAIASMSAILTVVFMNILAR